MEASRPPASKPWSRGGLLALALLSCRPPAPVAAPPTPTGCTGPSALDGAPTALTANLTSRFPCDPRPGAAGWVRADDRFAPLPSPPGSPVPPPLDVAGPRFALVLDGSAGPDLARTHDTLQREADYFTLVASAARLPRPAGEQAAPTAAGVAGLISSLRARLTPGTVLVVVATAVVAGGDDPWGCVPLVDGCYPLDRLRHELADLRTGARIVVLEQAGSPLAVAGLTGGATVVVGLPAGQAGAAAARAFWSRRVPDADRDRVVSVGERAAFARVTAPGVRLVDPLGTLSLGRRTALARGSAPLEVHGRAELDRAVAALAPGEIAVVNLSTGWCAACKPFRAVFDELSRRTGGPLRFIHAETDERWDGFAAPSYPAVAFLDRDGRLLALTTDVADPLAALHLTALDSLEDRIAHHRAELRSADAATRARAARAIRCLGPPGAALVDDLARDLHDEPVAAIVLDILAALGSFGATAREKTPELLAQIHHSSAAVRATAVQTLGLVGADTATILCPLVSLLPDPDSGVRRIVRELLATRDPAPLLPALRVILEDPDPAVRMAALTAFRALTWGDAAADALPTLVRLATPGEPPAQRSAALAALVDLGARAAPAVPDLVALLADEVPEIRREAAISLGQIGAPARCAGSALAERGDDPDPHTRRKAAEALDRIAAAEPR